MAYSFVNKTVVLVDDDIVVTMGVKRWLRGVDNCRFINFDNASDALEYLAQEKADAILCDILLPDLDGLNLVRELRRGSINADTPIVLVTAANAEDHQFKEGNDAMNVEVVLKPLSIDAIGDALAALG